MLRDRHQRCVEYGTGRRVRTLASQQKKEIVAEADLANQIACQIDATNHDGVLIRCANGRMWHRGPTDFQNVLLESWLIAFAAGSASTFD
jgi:hypothetical protein